MKRTTAEQEVSLVFHVICLTTSVLAVRRSWDTKFAWFTFQRYGGQWKYMSHWLLYANALYTVYALIVDIYNIITGYTCRPMEKDERPLPVRIRDEIFNTICFPFGVGHTLIFAVLTKANTGFFVSLINRRKEDLTAYYMMYLHVFPLVFCFLETVMTYHKSNRNRKQSMKISVITSLAFIAWVLCVAYFGSYWSYPFLRRASVAVRILCFVLYPLITAGCYILGEKVTEKLWMSVADVHHMEVQEKNKDD